MLELTIKETTYSFRFGMGFMRDIDKQSSTTIEGSDVKKNTGFQFAVADLYDRNPLGLVEILLFANKTEKPRVNRELLDFYIDEECEDIDGLCDKVLDFLKHGNATKKKTAEVLELIETEIQKLKEKEKQNQ